MKRFLLILLLPVLLLNCAYFNTFYMAQKSYKDAERQYKRDGEVKNSTSEKLYNEAILGAAGIIREYANSRYVDNSLFIMGMSYFRIEDYRQALTKFNEIIEAFPDGEFGADAIYYKARCLIEMDRYDDAKVILNDIMVNGERSQKGRAGIALVDIARRDELWDDLLTVAQNVIDTKPNDKELYEAIVYKGEALYNLERYEECVATLEQIPEKKIDTELRLKGNLQIALAKAKLGSFDESLEYLGSMQNKGEFAKYAPQIRLQIGIIYALKDEPEQAIQTYRNLAGDFPDSLSSKKAWYNAGMLLLNDLSRLDEAKEAFDNVGKNKAKATESWVSVAQTKSVQIDSLKAKLEAIGKLKDIDDLGKPEEETVVGNTINTETVTPDSSKTTIADINETDKKAEKDLSAESADTDTVQSIVTEQVISQKDSTAVNQAQITATVQDTSQTAQPDSLKVAVNDADSTKTGSAVTAINTGADSTKIATIEPASTQSDSLSSNTMKTVQTGQDTTKTGHSDSVKKIADKAGSIKAERENRAHLRFSLAELYRFSFDRPDSALTQYLLIIEETPETDYAVRSEYFLGLNELQSEDRYTEEADRKLMEKIIVKHPDSNFAQDLKVYLGIIEKPPEVKAFTEAEHSRDTSHDPEIYIPLYQKVVDDYPGTQSAYKAQFAIAYYTEHDVGNMEKALELYKEISKMDKNPYNSQFVTTAVDKLKEVEDEPKLLKEIEKKIVYLTYGTGRTSTESSEEEMEQVTEIPSQEEEITGYRKVRERNARIRSRYYTN
ncbi:MAG: tetratricopeptide repeat protein [Candidatus Latescibacteria bacterium]|nr:tetratricopeptide repeat protein [Candidatus Latescibacterota bacterium]